MFIFQAKMGQTYTMAPENIIHRIFCKKKKLFMNKYQLHSVKDTDMLADSGNCSKTKHVHNICW